MEQTSLKMFCGTKPVSTGDIEATMSPWPLSNENKLPEATKPFPSVHFRSKKEHEYATVGVSLVNLRIFVRVTHSQTNTSTRLALMFYLAVSSQTKVTAIVASGILCHLQGDQEECDGNNCL